MRVLAGDYAGSLFEDMLLHVLDYVHGREYLAGDVGGAAVGAASADGAGVAVQQLFPREILNFARAERVFVL